MKTNTLLALMILLQALWLGLKGTLGDEEYLDNAQALLWFTLLTGGLLLILPSVKPLSQFYANRVLPSLRGSWQKNHRLSILFFFIFVIITDSIFIPFLTPNQYDEASFTGGVQILIEKGPGYFFAHYSEIPWLGNQHPPLPVLLIGGAVPFFAGNSLLASRIFAGIMGIATLGCTYLIAAHLYNRRIAFLSMILLLGMRQFYFLNLISGNDIFIIFFFTLTVLLLLKLNTLDKKLTRRKVIGAAWAGTALSLGLLSKYTMVLAYLLLPALLIYPFANRFPGFGLSLRIKDRIKSGTPVLFITFLFSLPLAGIWLWYLFKTGFFYDNTSTFSTYLDTDLNFSSGITTTLAESEYVSDWRIRKFLEALVRRIPISIGPYNLPLIALGLWFWLKQERKRTPRWNDRFIAYWIAIVFIPILLTLPVDRYFVPAYPAIAILMANGLISWEERSLRVPLLALLFSISSALVFMASG